MGKRYYVTDALDLNRIKLDAQTYHEAMAEALSKLGWYITEYQEEEEEEEEENN